MKIKIDEIINLTADWQLHAKYAYSPQNILPSQVALLLKLSSQSVTGNYFFLCESEQQANEWNEFFLINNQYFKADVRVSKLPEISHWGMARHQEKFSQYQSLWEMTRNQLSSSRLHVVIGSFTSIAYQFQPFSETLAQRISLKTGENCDYDELIDNLTQNFYVESRDRLEIGTFEPRGQIIDIHPYGFEHPIRLRLKLSKIISIAGIDPATGRSAEEYDSLVVFPPYDFNSKKLHDANGFQEVYEKLLGLNPDTNQINFIMRHLKNRTLFSSLPGLLPILRARAEPIAKQLIDKNCTLFICGDGPNIMRQFQKNIDLFASQYEKDIEENKLSLPPEAHFDTSTNLEILKKSALKSISINSKHVALNDPSGLIVFGKIQSLNKDISILSDLAKSLNVMVSYRHKANRKLLRSHLNLLDLEYQEPNYANISEAFYPNPALRTTVDSHETPSGSGVILVPIALDGALLISDTNTLVISDSLILGDKKRIGTKSRKRPKAELHDPLDNLCAGDYVVHQIFGIGQYQGTKQLNVAGEFNEFIEIAYKNNDKMYLPLNQIEQISKHADKSARIRIDSLSSDTFYKKKLAARKGAKDIAAKLIKLYAQRLLAKPKQYQPPSADYYKFCREFEYTETDDQLSAIEEIELDLQSKKFLDRLICGDVGFGKTEVAMRAAMLAYLEGFQVFVIVPTTVLCFQHFKTFQSRMGSFGVKIAQLNRFVSAKQSKQTIEDIFTGEVDIVIGTHRLLSKDIEPMALGMIIVDEEHKFGVSHKERLKELKTNTDVLTLTATPIPRTLYQSLIGLKDVSLIQTPPGNRRSVNTFLCEFSESILREAIETEIVRGGQVFFVHNNIKDLGKYFDIIRKLDKTWRIASIHGRLNERALEKTLIDFISGKIDILLATTIVESGIDIPNVNTIIINNADRYGLAQLYQIKGRVGRGDRQASAYLIVEKMKSISEDAMKRLNSICQFSDLGSGYSIANEDLRIRGYGSLLSADQSGFVENIGIELYTKILREEISKQKQQLISSDSKDDTRDTLSSDFAEEINPEIKIKLPAYFPEDYVHNESKRIFLYRRLFAVPHEEALAKLVERIEDLYGTFPLPVENLFLISRIKMTLRRIRVILIKELPDQSFELKFSKNLSSNQSMVLLNLSTSFPYPVKFLPNNGLKFKITKKHKEPYGKINAALEAIKVIDELFQNAAQE